MSLLRRINNQFIAFSKYFFVVVSILICVLILANAIMRYIFQSEIYGINDVILLCAMWFYFIGCAVATYSDEHITADLIHTSLKSERARCLHDIIRMTLCLVLYVVATSWVYKHFGFTVEKGQTTSMLKIPVYCSTAALAFSFTLSVIYTACNLIVKISDYRKLRRQGEEREKEWQ